MKNKIIRRFIVAYILSIIIAIFVLSFFVGVNLKNYYEAEISKRLINNAWLAGDILKEDLKNNSSEAIQEKVQKLSLQLKSRLTVLDSQGKVLGDSEKNPDLMENHRERLEVIRAMEEGLGESNRFSDTLGYNMKYVAVAIKDGEKFIGILRLALPLIEVESQLRIIYRVVVVGGILVIIIVFILGYFISKSIANPIVEMKEVAQLIAKGDFSRRIKIKSDDEIGVLARSLNQMADELELKIQKLKKMNQIRTDFVANVSHELKTPLTSIKGFIETLEDGAIDDKENAGRFMNIIKKRAEGLSNIIDDLLTLSQLESGEETLVKENFDLKVLIEEVILGFGHALRQKQHKLESNFVGDDFLIKANKGKIEQVLINLIANAVKYTPEGGAITVNFYQKANNIILIVEDTGIGIPAEHINRVFERFYRVDKARSSNLGGTGLGLAIVKHIILLHRGEINIESTVNKGTKVTVSLPAV